MPAPLTIPPTLSRGPTMAGQSVPPPAAAPRSASSSIPKRVVERASGCWAPGSPGRLRPPPERLLARWRPMTKCVLYPAIDILGGRCVRLRQGDYGQVSAFSDDPVQVARQWRAQGATWLHVVDLDGAREGQARHLDLLRAMAQVTGLPIQYSGGLRTAETIAAALTTGAARVTLGTAAVENRALTQASLDRWGERIAISVDVRGGRLAIAGWLQT